MTWMCEWAHDMRPFLAISDTEVTRWTQCRKCGWIEVEILGARR